MYLIIYSFVLFYEKTDQHLRLLYKHEQSLICNHHTLQYLIHSFGLPSSPPTLVCFRRLSIVLSLLLSCVCFRFLPTVGILTLAT